MLKGAGVAAVIFAAAGCATQEGSLQELNTELLDPNPAAHSLQVMLPGLHGGVVQNESVFAGFGCAGENRSLALQWSGAPKKTESYAVIIHDPDAPTGVGFFHWVLFNLPRDTKQLDLGASQSGVPAGSVQGFTDFGTHAYGGPCPPPGAPHRYVVTVYALDVPKLDLGPDTTGALLRFVVRDHTLALGRAIAEYQR